MNSVPKYQTVKQFAAENPAFSTDSLRWLIFNAKTNGLSDAIVRIGRKVLIDTARFGEWIDSHRTSDKRSA